MSYAKINSKRQLLADFFTGRKESLQAYKENQEQVQRPYRWAVHNTTESVKYWINLDGSQRLLTDEEFDQIPTISKFILVNYSDVSKRLAPDDL